LERRPARYQRFDWPTLRLADRHEVTSDVDVLILEGVSVARSSNFGVSHAVGRR